MLNLYNTSDLDTAMDFLPAQSTMIHHPLFLGGQGETIQENDSPRIPFLPPIVAMATSAYPARSQHQLQHHHQNQQHQQHHQQQQEKQLCYDNHQHQPHDHTHHNPRQHNHYHQQHHHHHHQQRHRQQQKLQQQHQRQSTSSLPRESRESSIPLRLGPVARARTFAVSESHSYLPRLGSKVAARGEGREGQAARLVEAGRGGRGGDIGRYPRIVVKDALGRSLDTFTTLQEAIYRASWLRKKMGEYPQTALQWRLPKAPVPSKPDYTRAGTGPGQARLNLAASRDVSPRDPHSRQAHAHGGSRKQEEVGGARRLELTAGALLDIPTLEIPVDDVSFVRESLNHLPNLPAFTFLRHSLLAGRGTYVHIVASILLHQKQLRSRYQLDPHGQPISDENAHSADDVAAALQGMRKHKHPDYEFPGFCRGCRRAGFCYGCEKNPKPHVHEDVPAMMGGGFRFFRRDRPRDPHPWKHPGNWNLPESEQELMNIIK
ncbi:hypothetical protein EGW08_008765, partial [Elysia chlorotica]